MKVEYTTIDDTQKLVVADILSKKEAVEGELAAIQTERAQAQIGWDEKEQSLNAEKNKLVEEMRNIRKATLSVEVAKV